MNIENAIREISIRQEKTRKAKVRHATIIAIAVVTVLTILLVGLAAYSTLENNKLGLPPHLSWRHVAIVSSGTILACWFLGFLAVRDHAKSLLKHDQWEQHWLTCDLKDEGGLYQRGTILYDYGFYEEALDDYNICVQFNEAEVAASKTFLQIKESYTKPEDLPEEWKWQGKGLQRFFEDFPEEIMIVNGFPRPIPFYTPYEIERLEAAYSVRRRTLLKLGRDTEAEEDKKKINVILALIQEKLRMEKEYAKIFADGPTPYNK